MNNDELKTLVLSALQQVAPEIGAEDIEADEDIRECCDLDSMDFLNYLIVIKHATGIVISEADYAEVNTFNKMLRYLEPRLK